MSNTDVVIIVVFAMLPILIITMSMYAKLENAIKKILIEKGNEVEKTQWIPIKAILGDYVQEYHCSKCRFRITTGEYDGNRFKFCPRCGKEIEE